MPGTIKENEKMAYRELPKLQGLDYEEFRFMIILRESGLIKPVEVIYNGNSLYCVS